MLGWEEQITGLPGGLGQRERGEVGPKAGAGGRRGRPRWEQARRDPQRGNRGAGLTRPPTEPPAASHPHHLGTPALMNCKVFEINVF